MNRDEDALEIGRIVLEYMIARGRIIAIKKEILAIGETASDISDDREKAAYIISNGDRSYNLLKEKESLAKTMSELFNRMEGYGITPTEPFLLF